MIKHWRKIGLLALLLVVSVGLIACTKTDSGNNPAGEQNEQKTTALYNAGTYTAKAAGNNGDITVEVVFDDNSIVSVTVKDHNETDGLSDTPFERIPNQITEGQTLMVDVVSGASHTSKAILSAVEDCVRQAGGNPDKLKEAAAGQEEIEKVTEMTTDIVVIGGGGTGLAAAGSAFNNGADVILLEKQAVLGGSTGLSGGGISATGTRFQEEIGVEDTVESWMKLWVERQSTSNPNSLYPKYDRVETFMNEAVETTHWLVDSMNHSYARVEGYGLDPVARIHFPENGGSGLIANMEQAVRDKGIDILMETRATELIIENDGVAGVRAKHAGGEMVIHAKKVIIATGGFAKSEEMMQDMIPKLADFVDISAASAGSTGDGIMMAGQAGAALYEDPWVIGLGSTSRIREAAGIDWDVTKVLVNGKGERFMNENIHYALITNQIAEEIARSGQVWKMIDSAEANSQLIQSIEGLLPNDEMASGNTIAELAESMGVPAETLMQTIETFNEGVSSGKDAFGKDAATLVSVEQGPFYAFKYYPKTMGTFGGVKVNENYQVLKEDGSPISNLYAGGEAANRYLYNQVYMSGSAVQYALTSGRLSGQHAAQMIAEGK